MSPAAQPTVMLVVQQGFAARFLLRSGILRSLLDQGARVVVLAPNADESYMREEFADDRVTIEELRVGTELPGGSRLFYSLMLLRSHVLGHPGTTIRGKLRTRRAKQRAALGLRALPTEFALAGLSWLLWRSRTLRRAALALESRLFRTDLHAEVFARHEPDVVVAASPGWFLADAIVLREAAHHRVRTVALVLGWDNPTSKGYRGANPDLMIAWSESMGSQLERHHDLSAARIRVGGVAHWDHYVTPGALPSREALFAELDLDPERHLVLFATSTPSGYDRNEQVAEALAAATENGALGVPAQIVVRLHPINFRPDFTPPLQEYRTLLQRHPTARLDVPTVLSTRLRCDTPASDAMRLGALLAHCDVLVNVFSTTTLEAFLVDRPVVAVGAPPDQAPSPGLPDPRAYAQYTHLREVVEAGAVRVATTPPEIVAAARDALADPVAGHEARRRIAARECGPADGHSSERYARLILETARR